MRRAFLQVVVRGGVFVGIVLMCHLGAAPVAAQSWVVTHLAGSLGGPGSTDGVGSAARFSFPGGVAVDATGVVYVADPQNYAIRKVQPNGTVTTFAGGAPGSADGVGGAARFQAPSGVAVDAAGVLYVADTFNHTIRKVQPDGTVTTLAGLAGSSGSTDGVGSTARFFRPYGVAVDAAGVVYVADTNNHTIRTVQPDGTVATLAGLAGSAGSVNGTGTVARFRNPYGVAVDAAGVVYVGDSGNHTIRKIQAGAVTTLAGSAGAAGSTDGTGSAARFYSPSGVAVDLAGVVYVADRTNFTIRKVQPNGAVTTLAGLARSVGSADGIGSAARFYNPSGVAVDAAGVVSVADTQNSTIRKVQPNGAVTTLAGLAPAQGSVDGSGGAARFNWPDGVAVDAAGVVYVADRNNGTIRKVQPDGTVTTLAALGGTGAGVAVDAAGVVYVADSYNHTIRQVRPDGVVTTLAGLAGFAGSDDGVGSIARFRAPLGVAVDAAGVVYVADTNNHTIRKVQPNGTVTTLAGLAGNPGSADGVGSTARFTTPWDVAVDTAGVVYVADTGNYTIRKVQPDGTVTTLAGLAGNPGSANGAGSAARFFDPQGVAVDAARVVYVADKTNCTIRKVQPDGTVTTAAGQAGAPGSADGTGTVARFNYPSSVAVNAAGTRLVVADTGNNAIRDALGDADGDALPDSWETGLGLNPSSAAGDDGAAGDPDHDGWTNLQEYSAGTHPRGFYTRYFAEGAIIPGFFDVYLALLNVDPVADGHVLLRFQREGNTTVGHTVAVPALGRRTVRVNDIAVMGTPSYTAFSTVIESDVPVVADRTMVWDSRVYGAHAETSIASPAQTWYLAEGATHSGFELYYLIQNPNTTAVTVQVTYLRPSPLSPVVRQYAVAAASRKTIYVNGEGPELAATDVSAVIQSADPGFPIIVERAMYLTDAWGHPFGAGHESAGVTAPSTHWFLAEGATVSAFGSTGSFFDMYILIANPNAAAATVTMTYLLPDGTTVVKTLSVAANSRQTVYVNGVDAKLADTPVSTVVTATQPVIVERTMWWPGPTWATWYEAHNSPGTTETGTMWALAEGESGGSGVETYILIANTSASEGQARVTLLFEDGTPAAAEQTFTLLANSRRTIYPPWDFASALPAGTRRRYGAIIESVGTTPAQIVVERAMYANDDAGVTWAAGTNAVATKIR